MHMTQRKVARGGAEKRLRALAKKVVRWEGGHHHLLQLQLFLHVTRQSLPRTKSEPCVETTEGLILADTHARCGSAPLSPTQSQRTRTQQQTHAPTPIEKTASQKHWEGVLPLDLSVVMLMLPFLLSVRSFFLFYSSTGLDSSRHTHKGSYGVGTLTQP